MYRHIGGPDGIVLKLKGNLVTKREVTNRKLRYETHIIYTFHLPFIGRLKWGR